MKRIYLPLTIILCLGIVSTGMAQTNTSYGTGAGNAGNNNSSFGNNAGRIVTGAANTFFGHQAGYNQTNGYYNTFIGAYTGHKTTSGSSNIMIGERSGYHNTTGNLNIFIGTYSGHKNTTGYYNTFIGQASAYDNTTGRYNTFLGRQASRRNTSGSYNTSLGYSAGYNNQTGSRNVFLGYYAGYNETGSDKLYIDNSSTASPLIYGNFSTNIVNINGKLGVGTNTPDEKLTVKGKIHAEGLVCDLNIPAPDYVFEPDYRLRTLAEVEAYIQKHKHLPSVPSAKTMAKEGVQLLTLSMKLLEKVEELTLYTLAQQKEITQLKKQVKQLQQK
ncbi:MAG TPA: hypothetical protein DCS93_28205 [Microscillaceae bacterium]|nr:hypothetical protein [Microscillaceae bacterium]